MSVVTLNHVTGRSVRSRPHAPLPSSFEHVYDMPEWTIFELWVLF